MRFSTKIRFLLLFVVVFVEQVKSQCREQCAHPQNPTCAKIFKGQLSFEKTIHKNECNYTAKTKGKKLLLCCTSESGYKKYKAQKLAWTLSGAEENEYPHQVKLVSPTADGKEGGCGGTIYNKDWIVTAAHCIKVNGKSVTTVGTGYVIAGKSNVKAAKDEDKYYIAEIITHKDWKHDKIGQGHDVALLRLNRSLNLEEGKIQPIRLAQPGFEPPYGGQGVIIGWGNIHEKVGVGSTDLMEAQVPIHHPGKSGRLSFDQSEGGLFVLNQHVSVGGDDSGVTVGQGDSGGPLICPDENNKPILCGIASYKQCPAYKSCKQGNYYIRVDKFHGWIMKKIKNAPQEEELLFDLPVLPEPVKNADVPPFLVRVAGRYQSCSGIIVAPKLVITTAECMRANGGAEKLSGNAVVGHYSLEMPLKIGGAAPHTQFKPNISANIAKFFERPLALNDLFLLVLRQPVNETYIAKLPPVGYTIEQPAVEYTMGKRETGVEARRFLPMERDECAQKFKMIDENLELDKQHLCMRNQYSAGAECERDIGGALVCDGYLCGMKTFHACKASGFPEIFNDFTKRNTVRDFLEANIKAYS